MKTIYKYPLEITDKQTVILPFGAEILTVQTQNEVPCLWALIYTDRKIFNDHLIEMFGTGNPIPVDMGLERKYISTFQVMSGQLVFHVFEKL